MAMNRGAQEKLIGYCLTPDRRTSSVAAFTARNAIEISDPWSLPMPNFVYSTFTVNGPPEEVARFQRKMFITYEGDGGPSQSACIRPETYLNFDAVIPMPEEFKACGAEGWAVRNWGTKWLAFDVYAVEQEPGSLWFQFTTAWDFPSAAFEAIAAEFPKLVFEGSAYEENHEFEFEGQFNGDRPWGPAKLNFA